MVFLVVLAILFYASSGLLEIASRIRIPVIGTRNSQRAELIQTLDEPTATPVPRPAIAVGSPSPAAALVPTVTPTVSPTPAPEMRKVGNTGGIGVYLRRTPRLTDTLVAWPEGTRLEVVGADAVGDGVRWKQVRDPCGQVGWVPAQYVTPTTP